MHCSVYITFSLSIYVDGHLGYFYVLDMVNKAAVAWEHMLLLHIISFEIMFSLPSDTYPEVVLLNHMIIVLTFCLFLIQS